jgi:hypothetical protein
MSVPSTNAKLSNLLLALSSGLRALVLQAALSFRPQQCLTNEFVIALIQAASPIHPDQDLKLTSPHWRYVDSMLISRCSALRSGGKRC